MLLLIVVVVLTQHSRIPFDKFAFVYTLLILLLLVFFIDSFLSFLTHSLSPSHTRSLSIFPFAFFSFSSITTFVPS
jgi:hypothetical protein